MIDFWTLVILCTLGFIAGFIDAVAGGGGLIQLPALLSFLPTFPVASAIGINKFAGFLGTTTAAIRYVKMIKINWKFVAPAIVTAFIFSLLGSMMVSYLNAAILKPLVLGLLIIVFVYTIIVKQLGLKEGKPAKPSLIVYFSTITGVIIGFYDGFFGPGTGSFLIMIHIIVFGFDFLHASVYSKIINCVTNFSSLVFFLIKGLIVFQIAVPLAVCNIAGSWIGAKTAIKRGSGFVRKIYLFIVTILILKLGYEIFMSNIF